jgi:hypothetical protein
MLIFRALKHYILLNSGYSTNGGREKVDNNLVDVKHGYVWTGTGSLISRKTTQKAFGIKVF